MALYHDMTEMIGGTPLLALERLGQERGWQAKVLAKLEYFNPAGSVKDRAALGMIRSAEKEGRLRPGSVIVEPTSGNTGIGLAAIAAVRGYRVILTMPETMSLERRKLLMAYGAEIVLTPGDQGMQGSIDRAEELLREIPGSILAGQFDNSANPAAHYASTGPEIWRDTEGQVDIFVAGVGSAGTITGVGRYLKERRPAVEIVAAEPADSPVLSGGRAAPHGIQGIGANFVPGNYDPTVVDRVLTVATEDALALARQAARTEGVLVGISSGAALATVVQLALLPENAGKTIVTLLPDTGERYLSTELFA